MIRSLPTALRIVLPALTVLALSSAPAWPQGAAPTPTVMTAVASSRPPKDWYPRLAGVPVQVAGPVTFVLAGNRYQRRRLLVTFFADATQARVGSDLALFATDDVENSSDGASYYLTLHEEADLLPAMDAYNDLSEVRGAALLPEASSGPIPPTAAFGSGVDTAAPAPSDVPQSLWPGDVNGDFHVDLSDAILVLKAALGLVTLPPLESARADVERRGKIDIGDAVLTLSLAVGLSLPPPYRYVRP